MAGDPLDVAGAYRAGRTTFMGVSLLLAPGVLVPRAETELLGEAMVELLRDLPAPRMIDLCCGAGNLACGIATRVPLLQVWACDLTAPAVELARRNVEALGLSGRVQVLQGDMFAPLAGLEGTFDAIVCNPPYISSGKLAKDRASLLALEPREAFDGGPYGVSIVQRLVRDAPRFLHDGGALGVEVGLAQAPQVQLIIARSGAFAAAETRADPAGNARVVVARKGPSDR
ncbi:MAG TPA: HemK/PrmC family methyltransferase [Myxococcales bacterium]|nr:HemK/PrmC family methyltransferase [Myxococcales bacterium]